MTFDRAGGDPPTWVGLLWQWRRKTRMTRRSKKSSHPAAQPDSLVVDPALVIDAPALFDAGPVAIAKRLAEAQGMHSYLTAETARVTSKVIQAECQYRLVLATAHNALRAGGVPREDIRHREILDPHVQKALAELHVVQSLKRDVEAKVSIADQMMKVLSRMQAAVTAELEKLPTPPRPIRR